MIEDNYLSCKQLCSTMRVSTVLWHYQKMHLLLRPNILVDMSC